MRKLILKALIDLKALCVPKIEHSSETCALANISKLLLSYLFFYQLFFMLVNDSNKSGEAIPTALCSYTESKSWVGSDVPSLPSSYGHDVAIVTMHN